MKTCTCGGQLYRHGKCANKPAETALRYRCLDCRKCITVRDGQVSTLRGRPAKLDWRATA